MVTPLCILLVDDSKFFLELEKQFLRNTPATILLATSGEEAIALAREYRPSLIYACMNMSKMSGQDYCRALRSDPGLSDTPIILIGDRVSAADESEAMAAGANAYISKPLDRRVFLGTGHRYLLSIDRREPRRECDIPVNFQCRGRGMQGRCIDLSSGGMFLECNPTAQKGETLVLEFSLPDEGQTSIEVKGYIAWANSTEEIIKVNYPFGYGLEFVDITDKVGTALRRCFGT